MQLHKIHLVLSLMVEALAHASFSSVMVLGILPQTVQNGEVLILSRKGDDDGEGGANHFV